MAKHITLLAAQHPEFADKVLVKVIEQTHRGFNFGNIPWDLRKFRASNGLVLGSNEYPAKDTDDKNLLWLQGLGTAKQNGTTIVLLKGKFEKLKAAVQEYNEYFSDYRIAQREREELAARRAAEQASMFSRPVAHPVTSNTSYGFTTQVAPGVFCRTCTVTIG